MTLNYLISLIHSKMCAYRTLHRLLSSEEFQEYYKSVSTRDRMIIHVYILGCNMYSIRRMMKTLNKYEGMKLIEIRSIAAKFKIKNYLYKSKELLIDEILEVTNEKDR